MEIKTQPGPRGRRQRPPLDVDALIATARAQARHAPKRTGQGLAIALAHARAVEHGHVSGSSLSGKLRRAMRRRPASG